VNTPITILADIATGANRDSVPGGEPTFSPKGGLLATWDERDVIVFDLAPVKSRHRLPAGPFPDSQVVRLRFSPDGSLLYIASAGGKPKLWETATGRQRGTVEGFHAVFAPDSRTLATVLPGPVVKLWDTATGTERAELRGFKKGSFDVEFAPDGKRLLTTASDFGLGAAKPTNAEEPPADQTEPLDLRLWDADTGKELATLPGSIPVRQAYRHGVFTPDGTAVVYHRAEGGPRLELAIWDVAAGKERATVRDVDAVGLIAIAPDSRTLWATAGRVLKCYDTADGRELFQALAKERITSDVRLSPDGRSLTIAVVAGETPAGRPSRMEVRAYQIRP
jgi:WD40 repeat protein